jgi:2-oxoglutarate dehydrogenase E2 component (dihydrolipoamide succinyltransferase)
MKIEVKVPQLSESVSEASLLTWNKQVGEAVMEGESLIDIETDKVVLELPAIKSGVLTDILKQNGDKVSSGEVIALLDTEAKPAAGSAVKPAAAAQAVKVEAAVMPAAKKIAAEKNIDTAISGSGRGGRVTKEDVLSAPAKSAAPVANIPQPQAGGRIEQRVPMTRIRQRIAERLLQSQQQAAILTTFNE